MLQFFLYDVQIMIYIYCCGFTSVAFQGLVISSPVAISEKAMRTGALCEPDIIDYSCKHPSHPCLPRPCDELAGGLANIWMRSEMQLMAQAIIQLRKAHLWKGSLRRRFRGESVVGGG